MGSDISVSIGNVEERKGNLALELAHLLGTGPTSLVIQ
jgi:hypothetical protein